MSNILHVLNGDATAFSFPDTGLEGDLLVWREILSQGPVNADINSGNFWKARKEWISQTFNEPASDYEIKVLDPLEKLNADYEQINLWFEFDLHCQANLLGVLALLSGNTNLSPPAVYLICPKDFPGKSNFKGMGELNGKELQYLFDTIRVELGEPDFFIAAEAWALYVESNADAIEKWIADTKFWGALTLLKPALEAHIRRLRTNEQGLNYIEQYLLSSYQSGAETKQELYQRFWDTQQIYGMGDLEIDLYLKRLQALGLIRL